jgi:2-aminoadipate transaminase
MIDYSPFLSTAARTMAPSAIRAMGALAAGRRDVISFAPGYPAPSVFPWEALREIASELLTGADGAVLQYGATRGLRRLLEALVTVMAERSVQASIDELMIVSGSQQALDLTGRILCDPGDVILVELPTYVGAITAFRGSRAHLVGVRQEPDGVDLDDLVEVLTRERSAGRTVRALYVVPNFQNPTGLLISLEKRRRLLELAAQHDLLIIEDDPYGELYFEDVTTRAETRPLKADDAEGRVVYLSTFSKTLAPGFRTAWITAPAPIIEKLEIAKQSADLCTGGLDQHMVYESWRRGVLSSIAPSLRAHYRRKRDVMERTLRAELGDRASWPAPRGGFFLWISLPEGLDATRMLPRAIEQRVLYVIGSAFFVDGGGSNTLRLSFSHPPESEIEEGTRRLCETIRTEIAPGRTATDAVR